MSSDASNAIAAIAACAQAVVLVVAAIIAFRQVQEARRVREEQAQPYVIVSLQTDPASPFMLNLIIENMGKTVAREVFVTFEPQLISSLDKDGDPNRLSEWTALKEGIRTLVPGQSMSTLVDSLMIRYAGGGSPQLREKVRATVRYTGDGESPKRYRYDYDLDFNVFFGQHWIGRKGIDDLVKSVDEIRKTLEGWTTNHGLTVYGKDLDKLKAEEAARLEELRARWAEEQAQKLESDNDSDANIGANESPVTATKNGDRTGEEPRGDDDSGPGASADADQQVEAETDRHN